MLDIKRLRENPDEIQAQAKAKGVETDIRAILALDDRRKGILAEVEELKARRNSASKKIGELKRTGGDAQAAMDEVASIKGRIDELDGQQTEVEAKIREAMSYIPNIPQPGVPEGKSSEDNVEVRVWGEEPADSFERIDHKTFGEKLGLFDFERGAKISGSGFPVYTGMGARLERALISYFIDTLTSEFGYVEVLPPHMVNEITLFGTSQLPKFRDQLYTIPEDGLFMIPTAEVPVTNLHAREVMREEQLPTRYCAYTPCFRREAGSWGREVRGFLRLHQFDKVEMVQFARPEDSNRIHQEMVEHAQRLLKGLGLRHRVIELCKGDLGFGAARCYDVEVWSPVEKKWLESSSVSNFEDFQARRAEIRYKSKADGKVRFVHTLNGSGLATPRVIVALLDTYQQPDGSLVIPEVLRPAMGTDRIEPKA